LQEKYSVAGFMMIPIEDRDDFNCSFPNKFIDAILSGIHPIIPDGTAMANFCRRADIGLIYSRSETSKLDDYEIKRIASKKINPRDLMKNFPELSHLENYDRLSSFLIRIIK